MALALHYKRSLTQVPLVFYVANEKGVCWNESITLLLTALLHLRQDSSEVFSLLEETDVTTPITDNVVAMTSTTQSHSYLLKLPGGSRGTPTRINVFYGTLLQKLKQFFVKFHTMYWLTTWIFCWYKCWLFSCSFFLPTFACEHTSPTLILFTPTAQIKGKRWPLLNDKCFISITFFMFGFILFYINLFHSKVNNHSDKPYQQP